MQGAHKIQVQCVDPDDAVVPSDAPQIFELQHSLGVVDEGRAKRLESTWRDAHSGGVGVSTEAGECLTDHAFDDAECFIEMKALDGPS